MEGQPKYLSDYDSKKGLNISPLEPGTVLTCETQNSFYKIEIVEGKDVLLTGGMTKEGEHRFLSEPAKFHGSTWGGSVLKIDWVGKDMCLELSYEGEDSKRYVFTSSPVIELEITAPQEDWSYKMDWKEE